MNPNITIIELPEPLEEIGSFKWHGRTTSLSTRHSWICWKGERVLFIKKVVDLEEPRDSEDEDDEDYETSVFPETVKYYVQCDWDWLKFNYGETESLAEARELAITSIEGIFENIRKAFMMKAVEPKKEQDENL